MSAIRQAAAAGTFYPRREEALRKQIREFLARAQREDGGAAPKAMILPHAGYVFSGQVAAFGYACLEPVRESAGEGYFSELRYFGYG